MGWIPAQDLDGIYWLFSGGLAKAASGALQAVNQDIERLQ
jgi:hypothetical protein